MTAAETLAAIARGEQPVGLLPTCRLQTDSGAAQGIEAVAAHFRAAPLRFDETIGEGGTLAAAAEDTMVFAECYGPNITRLWRAGSDGPVGREAAVDVAFDPDMHQGRGDVFSSPSDFPHVDAGLLDRIVETARAAIGGDEFGAPATRRRLFLLRVATEDEQAAALFAHLQLPAGEPRDMTFRYAGLLLGAEREQWFVDWTPRAKAWTPRV